MIIIDLSQGLAGPFAGALLAELGAEVIKVEPPGGDPQRQRAAADAEDESFAWANRRKRSIAIDLRRPAGRDLVLRLAERADALIESFAPRALGRMGLSFRALRRSNPSIVLTSVTPFGHPAPGQKLAEYELAAAGNQCSHIHRCVHHR